MVSKLLKLCFFLVLLATVVHSEWDEIFDELQQKLNQMARKGTKIDGLFKLVENGTIKRGNHGFVFRGIMVKGNVPVALKFVALDNRAKADLEFKMYGYLDAINKTNVQKYGIPSLYYYQEWEGLMLSALPLFDGGDLGDLFHRGYFDHKNSTLSINSLILFRDFVMQSKYIHSRGIRHNSIKPLNIATKNSQSFLFDFTASTKMLEYSDHGTWPFFPKKAYNQTLLTPKSEWESFLYVMAYLNGIELGWMFHNLKFEAAKRLINNINRTISKIEKAPIACPVLKSVFILFAKDALNNQDSLPSYNDVYESIVEKIYGKFGSHRNVMFTWLNDRQRSLAKRENYRSFNIGDVPEVSPNFQRFRYTEYSLDFFPNPLQKKRSLYFCRCSNG